MTLTDGVCASRPTLRPKCIRGGNRIVSLVMRSDAEKDPTEIVLGSLAIELILRGGDLAIRVRDAKSPLRVDFPGLRVYPIDPSWRIVARFESFAREKEVVLEDGDGKPQPYLSPGAALFEKDGKACRLEPVFDSDRKRLFVLFSDATNRDETYGAGRFLYAPLPRQARWFSISTKRSTRRARSRPTPIAPSRARQPSPSTR